MSVPRGRRVLRRTVSRGRRARLNGIQKPGQRECRVPDGGSLRAAARGNQRRTGSKPQSIAR